MLLSTAQLPATHLLLGGCQRKGSLCANDGVTKRSREQPDPDLTQENRDFFLNTEKKKPELNQAPPLWSVQRDAEETLLYSTPGS